jgi:hypothetical protein
MIGAVPHVCPHGFVEQPLASLSLRRDASTVSTDGLTRINDGLQVSRLARRQTSQFLESRDDGPAMRVAHDNHEPSAEARGRNSTLPICEGATIFPATRMTNKSPNP